MLTKNCYLRDKKSNSVTDHIVDLIYRKGITVKELKLIEAVLRAKKECLTIL